MHFTDLFIRRPVLAIVVSLTLLLMSMVIGMVAFDIALFCSRSLLHTNPGSLNQNLIFVSFLISFFFFSALVFDVIELTSLNIDFIS